MPHLRPFQWLLDVGPAWSVARHLAPRLLLGRFRTRELGALLQRTLARLPRRIVVTRMRAAQGANAIAAFARVGVPTMYLHGTEDALLPPSCVDEVCRLAPKTRVVKIPAPHCLLQCAPEEGARAIGQFLKSV
jgi:pimeloyl-ACP methyl ester carboxylesterase